MFSSRQKIDEWFKDPKTRAAGLKNSVVITKGQAAAAHLYYNSYSGRYEEKKYD
jgi:hypothetical protein